MRFILKVKLVLFIFALALLVIIPGLENNFWASHQIVRWRVLTWDDFKGVAQPFSQWGATISSNVYLEKDSLSNYYTAYAGQNPDRSWTRRSTKEDSDALIHEQYHFNITELHARKLDQLLSNTADSQRAHDLLDSIRISLRSMQFRYDNQTDHSINSDYQGLWEYKIDSSLAIYSRAERQSNIFDPYSGAILNIPTRGTVTTKEGTGVFNYRYYYGWHYGLPIVLSIYQYVEPPDLRLLKENLHSLYKEEHLELTKFDTLSSQYPFMAYVNFTDKSDSTIVEHLWTYFDEYLYRVSIDYPQFESYEGFEDMTSSLFKEFEIVNTEAYWIDRLKKAKVQYSPLSSDSDFCLVNNGEGHKLFYKNPFLDSQGNLILVFDIPDSLDNSIHSAHVIVNGDMLSIDTPQDYYLFSVPANQLNRKLNQLDFGYTLKEDSLNDCRTFYYQSIQY